MFYIDVKSDLDYVFYYNMTAEINKSVSNVVGDALNMRPISNDALSYMQNESGGSLGKTGPTQFGMLGQYDYANKSVSYESILDLAGITAQVNAALASEILEKAKMYCPKDTGTLANSGRIEIDDKGQCRIFFDCYYAWFVHENTWCNHAYPTCAKFLTLAIYEVEKAHGLGWA